MGTHLRGKPVADVITDQVAAGVEALKKQGKTPKLAIVRVGANPDDLSYERGAKNRMAKVGIDVQVVEMPEDVSQEVFEDQLAQVNTDPSVSAILLFKPLPSHLDAERADLLIDPKKDVDGTHPRNQAAVFAGSQGFAPCTPSGAMELIRASGVQVEGARAVVVGRSMVVGKPIAMLLMQENATVTVCHSRTRNLGEVCKEADILVAAIGRAGFIQKDWIKPGALVIDVGINVDEEGKLVGDVDPDAVEVAGLMTPVPGGVGSVTTAVLAKHVLQAAERA